jgi:hypothetical protein
MKSLDQVAGQTLVDYYRIAPDSLPCTTASPEQLSGELGFFQFFGQTCYGRSQLGTTQDVTRACEFEASGGVLSNGLNVQFPFKFGEVVDNLRRERYQQSMVPRREAFARTELVRKLYYLVRPGLRLSLRRHFQRAYFSDWRVLRFPRWPVDFTVDALHQRLLGLLMYSSGVKKLPFVWFWPEGARSGLIVTHDVETAAGRDFTSQLMDLDEFYGIKASFQVIPERRYKVSDGYVSEIRRRGFEFNIHDLNHDGSLYRERREFDRRVAQINKHVHTYGARGFRAASMYRKQDWYDGFEFSYDMSVPNVAHLEPMRGGCCTVMPYFVGKIVELPLTLAQDYSLFQILGDYSIDLWKRQIALVKEKNGLISLIAHPDYLIEQREQRVYESLLDFLTRTIKEEHIWATLPGDVDLWWRARSQMSLVARGDNWEIVGPGKERARLAYATLDGNQVLYELDGVTAKRDLSTDSQDRKLQAS